MRRPGRKRDERYAEGWIQSRDLVVREAPGIVVRGKRAFFSRKEGGRESTPRREKKKRGDAHALRKKKKSDHRGKLHRDGAVREEETYHLKTSAEADGLRQGMPENRMNVHE